MNDGVRGRQAKPGPLASTLGGEEWLERARERNSVHARASVGHAEHYVSSGRKTNSRRIFLTQQHRAGLNNQAAAVWHGVAGICREVQQYLFDLGPVGFDASHLAVQTQDQLNVFADQSAQDLLQATDDLVQFHDLGPQQLLAAEGQKPLDESGAALSGPADLFDFGADSRLMRKLPGREVRISYDHGEEIVKVVCDAGRQAAHRFHLMRLTKLFLKTKAGGNIFRNPNRLYRDAAA